MKSADIFSQFEQIHERLEQAYRRLTGGPGRPAFCQPYIEPPVDVYETDTEVVVLVEMAGIGGEEIQLEIEGRVLALQGQRPALRGPQHRTYSQMEIANGPFRREMVLPAEVNVEQASVTYRDGILEVVLPKARPAGNHQLRIVAR
jgi:HSP20 family protein